ncbi:MAG: hypothetical protein PHH22_03305 [Clostridia bacterium]|nr:hypothetical protein [Clostridia bacterium]
MKYTIKLIGCLVLIVSLCLTLGVIASAYDIDHRIVILKQTDTYIKGYATTWHISVNHTLVHGAGTYAWANSGVDYNLGGQRSTTAIIEGYGTVLGSHYNLGTRSGCVCETVWN